MKLDTESGCYLRVTSSNRWISDESLDRGCFVSLDTVLTLVDRGTFVVGSKDCVELSTENIRSRAKEEIA